MKILIPLIICIILLGLYNQNPLHIINQPKDYCSDISCMELKFTSYYSKGYTMDCSPASDTVNFYQYNVGGSTDTYLYRFYTNYPVYNSAGYNNAKEFCDAMVLKLTETETNSDEVLTTPTINWFQKFLIWLRGLFTW
jgi:hypothetical protein